MTTKRVVRRIDHVAMAVDDAHRVFDMLRDRLGLVVIMPVTIIPVSVAGYPLTSWFNLGSMPLEVLELPEHLKRAPGPLGIQLVFEPELVDEAVKELDRRGIPYAPPIQLLVPEGIEPPLWDVPLPPEATRRPEPGSLLGTQLLLQGGFVGGNVVVLCYEWVSRPVAVMREAMRQRLDEIPNRPMPIDGVTEVVVGAIDVAAERGRWQALLDPVEQDEPGLWRFGGGPALRLVEHERDAILGLKFLVTSLERAESYLKEHDMLVVSSGDELGISPEALEGLNVTLVGG